MVQVQQQQMLSTQQSQQLINTNNQQGQGHNNLSQINLQVNR